MLNICLDHGKDCKSSQRDPQSAKNIKWPLHTISKSAKDSSRPLHVENIRTSRILKWSSMPWTEAKILEGISLTASFWGFVKALLQILKLAEGWTQQQQALIGIYITQALIGILWVLICFYYIWFVLFKL